MVTTTINGVEYPLATTLRVAYKVQGEHIFLSEINSTLHASHSTLS